MTTANFTARQKKVLREMSKMHGVYYWSPATTKQLLDAGFVKLVIESPPGYQLTEAGIAAVRDL